MRIAVLADIHSNHKALEKCIGEIERRGVDMILLLGDYVGELANPELTMELLYSLEKVHPCVFLRGNKEDYWLSKWREKLPKGPEVGDWKLFDSTTGCLCYAYNHLTEKDMRFFASMEICEELELPGLPGITLCHGSRNSNKGCMLDNDAATYDLMDEDPHSIILAAHTHIQGEIRYNGKVVLNPGSVGLSYDAMGKAQYMMLYGDETNGRWSYDFVSVEYDRHSAIEELHTSGLDRFAPGWTAITRLSLAGEKISHANMLLKVMEFQRKDIGRSTWPQIPEKYWNNLLATISA